MEQSAAEGARPVKKQNQKARGESNWENL